MRKIALMFLLTVLAALPLQAQRLKLDFPELEDIAEERVDVTLDADMLHLAAKFLSNDDADERAVRDMINGLQGIYVRSYEFSRDGQYSRSLVERVISQLGPSWKPLVTVRSKKRDNVDIYAQMKGDKVGGLVIVATEPREFTVVNIEGTVDIDRLASLEGQFGIPRIMKGKNHDRDRDHDRDQDPDHDHE
jgi:Domain of unknown function (DUF4252)